MLGRRILAWCGGDATFVRDEGVAGSLGPCGA
jgi:hypothetical protein